MDDRDEWREEKESGKSVLDTRLDDDYIYCDGAIKYLSHFKAYEVGKKRLNIPGRATIRNRMGTDAIRYSYHQTGVYFSHVWRRGSLALDPSQNKFQLRFHFWV